MRRFFTRLLFSLMTIGTLSVPARAQDGDPGMAIMMMMLRCPAIAADGSAVAVYSFDPASVKGAKTSLAIFTAAGVMQQRIAIVPPAVDLAQAKAGAAKATALLNKGGFKRMGRVARKSQTATRHEKPADPAPTYDAELSSGDAVFSVHLADRKLTVTPTRAGKKLEPINLSLAKTDGPCKPVKAYSITNTLAGFDAAHGVLAFSIDAEDADAPNCFSHDFVVTIK